MSETEQLLQRAIAAAKAGDKATARRLLIEVTERDEHREEAWLWLSGVVDDLEEMKICLENVLEINPANARARQGLEWVQRRLVEQQAPPPPPPPPLYPSPTPVEEPVAAAPDLPSFPFPPAARMPPPIEEQIAAEPTVPPAPEEEPEADLANRISCPACGAKNFDFATECVKCGFPFAIVCPSCNELVPTETGLCPHCDAELPLPTKLDTVRQREVRIDDAYRQGLAYMQQGRYQEAKPMLEEALLQAPGHVEALYNLGLVCAKLGLRGEAQQYWEEVRARQPSYPDIQKDLDSLLSPRERRRMAKERRKAVAEQRKKKRDAAPPAGRTLIYEYEKSLEPKPPVPEEEMGGVESFLYVLVVGLVVGVTYALNQSAVTPALSPGYVLFVLKHAGVAAVALALFWLILVIASRLLSLIFRAEGAMGGYSASAARFLMPFFLLIVPVVLGIPQIVALLPEMVVSWLKAPLDLPALRMQLPPLAWLVFGGISLFWGMFAFVRGLSRVGRIALWKGFLVGLAATAVAGGAIFGAYFLLDRLGYLQLLQEQVLVPPPTPSGTPSPSPIPPGETPTPSGL